MSVIKTRVEFETAISVLEASNDDLFVDIESNGLDPYNGNQICGVGVGTMDGDVFYFPFRHKTPDSNLPHDLLDALISLLNKVKRVYGYNLKFDARFLEDEGVDFDDKVMVDVLPMVRLTEHSDTRGFSQTDAGIRRFGPAAGQYDLETKAVLASNGWKKDFSLAPPDILGPYCIQDVLLLIRLYEDCLDKIRSSNQMKVWALMLDSTKALFDVEGHGVLIDTVQAHDLKDRIEKRMKALEAVIFADAGKEFNISSSPQIGKIMNERGVHSPVRTPKCAKDECDHEASGEPHKESWAEEALVQIDSPFAGVIKQYRTLKRMVSTYLVPYMDNETIHTTFANWGTATGRLSSIDPNLQNVPASVTYITEQTLETEEDFEAVRERVKAVALSKGKVDSLPDLSEDTLKMWAYLGADKYTGAEGECHLRTLISARPGYKLVSMDYSQMEVRMLLFYIGTPEATALLHKEGVDFHDENAMSAYSIDKDHPEFSFYRNLAKILTFGVIYGMGEKKLAMTLQITRMQAREYKNTYINKLPGFRAFLNQVKRVIERTGQIRNKYGRVYRIKPSDAYKGINFLIQGTSAEIVTERFIECVKYLKDKKSRMLIQVHDELVFEIHESEYHEVIGDLKRIMEENSLGLPLPVDIEIANPTWAEKIKYEPETVDIAA